MKTVKQIAIEYGVSVQAIRKRLNRLATKLPTGTTERVSGVLYINPDAERILTAGLQVAGSNQSNHESNQSNQGSNHESNQSNPVYTLDTNFAAFLTEQLTVKDAQIAELQRQNAELQMLLKNEQMLKALPLASAVPEAGTVHQTDEQPRGNFFQRFFKRK